MLTHDNFEELRPSHNADFVQRVLTFTTGFSQRIDAGESIVSALDKMARQEPNPHWRAIILKIGRNITGDGQTGATLSDAMSNHGEIFSGDYIAAVQRGESGDLRVALKELGDELHKS